MLTLNTTDLVILTIGVLSFTILGYVAGFVMGYVADYD